MTTSFRTAEERAQTSRTHSPDYLAYLYGKEQYRKGGNPDRVKIRVKKLADETGVSLAELMKSAREGYSAARSVDTLRAQGLGKGVARALVPATPSHMTVLHAPKAKKSAIEKRYEKALAENLALGGSGGRSGDRRGTNHKHPAGRTPCPKCGV